MVECAQPPVGVGAEPDPLHRGAAVADDGEHLAAGQDDPDRAVEDGGGHRGEHHMRAGRLGAEATADVFGPYPYRVRVEREQLRQFIRHEPAALIGVDDLQPAAVPARHRRMRLQRAVVLFRCGVFGVHDHRGRGEFGLQVPLRRLCSRHGGILRCVHTGAPGGEGDVVRLLVIADDQSLGGFPGLLRGFRDDQRHRPADMRHPVVLEDLQDRVG